MRPTASPGVGRLLALCLALLCAAHPSRAEDGGNGFTALCYHDVVLEMNDLAIADAMPITLVKLVEHFDWIRDNGYNVIGVDDILAAREGTRPLPEKAILLSFDDGYTSFHRFVFPLLKAYNFKAMLALQTGWLETPYDKPVHYGVDAYLPRTYFLAWEHIKEMADSGYVELASHTHNLHRGQISAPQKITQPAAASLAYDLETGTYETPERFYNRVRSDLAHSADTIERHTGHRPRVMVWPYGRYNHMSVRAALDAGYLLTASLWPFDDGNTFARYLIYNNMPLFNAIMEAKRGFEPGLSTHSRPSSGHEYVDLILPVYQVQRVMHVDLDAVYDADPIQQYRNVSALLDRVLAMGINVVYLQAYADPDGNGTADALYFPNRHLPMRADLFNYISWQLATRCAVQVYAWMPVLGFEIPGRPLVEAMGPGTEGSTYARLTPFDAENRRIVKEIYEDLGRHSNVDGILYHDDAILGDYEDTSPAAMEWMRGMGLEPDLEFVRRNPEMMQYFTRMKSRYLIDFTNELTAAMEIWSQPLRTARNIYAQVVLRPESETWYAQNFCDFLDNYDYVGLMAMPYMEGERRNPDGWLKKLANVVKTYPLGKQKTVFELQAVDWHADHRGPIPSETLARQMRMLQINGIGNLGYYPEDPFKNHPDIDVIYPAFSLKENIYERHIYDQAAAAQAMPPEEDDKK